MIWRNLSVTLKVRLISNFFQELITSAFLPFIALYLSDMANPKFAGIFLTLLVVANFPVSLIGGYLIETFPKKKAVLIYQFVMAIMLLLMGIMILNGSSYIIFFSICYAIYNIVWGVQYPAMDTIIMDAITADVERYIYKIDYWLTNLALAFGALMGGILYHNNKSTLFFIAFLIFILVFLSLLRWLPKETHVTEKRSLSMHPFNVLKSYEQVFKDRRFMVMTLGFSIMMMGELSASSYIAIRLKAEFNTISVAFFNIDGVKLYSLLMIVNTIVVITCTYFVTKIILKLSVKKSLILGLIFYVICYASITYLNEFYSLILLMFIATIGEIIYSPILDEQRFKIIPENKRGTYSAFNALGFNLSELIARLGIILGVYLSSIGMGIYMFIFLSIGAFFIYLSIYGNFKLQTPSQNKVKSIE